MSDTKHCPKCNKDLPLDAFYKRSSEGESRQSYCKSCVKALQREWRATHSDHIRASRRAWQAARKSGSQS